MGKYKNDLVPPKDKVVSLPFNTVDVECSVRRYRKKMMDFSMGQQVFNYMYDLQARLDRGDVVDQHEVDMINHLTLYYFDMRFRMLNAPGAAEHAHVFDEFLNTCLVRRGQIIRFDEVGFDKELDKMKKSWEKLAKYRKAAEEAEKQEGNRDQ